LNKKNVKGFTLLEILIVIVIAGLGLMTVAPRLAENTILTDKTEKFFNEIVESHLKEAKELNKQVSITGFKGSSNIVLHDGTRVSIPAGNIATAYVNEERTNGLEYKIYFYPDGIFDQFRLMVSDKEFIESYPALLKVVHK
jgi:prepilin-type N-terminal cleavage/methylation domain-containing protein